MVQSDRFRRDGFRKADSKSWVPMPERFKSRRLIVAATASGRRSSRVPPWFSTSTAAASSSGAPRRESGGWCQLSEAHPLPPVAYIEEQWDAADAELLHGLLPTSERGALGVGGRRRSPRRHCKHYREGGRVRDGWKRRAKERVFLGQHRPLAVVEAAGEDVLRDSASRGCGNARGRGALPCSDAIVLVWPVFHERGTGGDYFFVIPDITQLYSLLPSSCHRLPLFIVFLVPNIWFS